MGGIHPRDKKPVGDRLGQAAYNLVYDGKGAYTGPTLSTCSVSGTELTVQFDAKLLNGDKVRLNWVLSSGSVRCRGAHLL